MLRQFFLRSPDPGQGGDPAPPPEPETNLEPQLKPKDNSPPNPDPDPPQPPPAGKIVVEAEKTERELELEAALKAERHGRKKDQTRLSELEDENHQLKKIPREKPKRKAEPGPMSRFFGWED